MANKGKIIVISALDSTFERKKFGNITDLIPMAERVEKLDAVCVDCKGLAHFTKRTIQSKKLELIGGAEVYKPVCRKCFNKTEDSDMRQPLKEISKSDQNQTEFQDENESYNSILKNSVSDPKETSEEGIF